MKKSFRFFMVMVLLFFCRGGDLLSQDGNAKQTPNNHAANAVKFDRKNNGQILDSVLYRQPDLSWRIVSMNFGWEMEAVRDILEKTEDSKIIDILNDIDYRSHTSVKLYSEAEVGFEIGVEAKGSLSLNPVKLLRSEVNVNAHASASTKLGIAATGELDWRTQNQNRSRNLSTLMQSVDSRLRASSPYIDFSVRFVNLGDQAYICDNLQVPVMIGPKVVTYAQCYEIEASTSFNIPPNRPQGIPVRFRARLDNTQALELLADLQKASPLFKLENSRGSIIAMRTKEDVISQIQISNTKTCLLTIRHEGAPPISWQIYRGTPSSPVTLKMAMEAINARVKELTYEPLPVFCFTSGIIDSIAGFDNRGPWWHMYINGKSVPLDLDFKITSNVEFGLAHEVPKFRTSYTEAIHTSAQSGNPLAQAIYGRCLFEGVNVEKDYSEAVKWFRLSADQGYSAGQADLGRCYILGKGVAKDEQEAVKWLRLAADQGHYAGQADLGRCYLLGTGIPKDEEKAVNLLRRAADQGHSAGQVNLGRCYLLGIGIPKNEEKAVELFRLAADHGAPFGQAYLGWCYLCGTGITKDEPEAVKWLRLAADQGDVFGQVLIGQCYLLGTGVTKNEQEAVKWFRLAAEQGSKDAEAELKKLER